MGLRLGGRDHIHADYHNAEFIILWARLQIQTITMPIHYSLGPSPDSQIQTSTMPIHYSLGLSPDAVVDLTVFHVLSVLFA